jgi:hypothetical protein
MRASLVANTVHIPDTWAGWRMHPEQATRDVSFRSAELHQKIEEMIEDALQRTWMQLPVRVREGLRPESRQSFGLAWDFQRDIRRYKTQAARVGRLLSQLAVSAGARAFLLQRLRGIFSRRNSPGDVVEAWLQSRGLAHSLNPE